MPWLVKAFVAGQLFLGLSFALVLFLGWLSGKIEVHINKEP